MSTMSSGVRVSQRPRLVSRQIGPPSLPRALDPDCHPRSDLAHSPQLRTGRPHPAVQLRVPGRYFATNRCRLSNPALPRDAHDNRDPSGTHRGLQELAAHPRRTPRHSRTASVTCDRSSTAPSSRAGPTPQTVYSCSSVTSPRPDRRPPRFLGDGAAANLITAKRAHHGPFVWLVVEMLSRTGPRIRGLSHNRIRPWEAFGRRRGYRRCGACGLASSARLRGARRGRVCVWRGVVLVCGDGAVVRVGSPGRLRRLVIPGPFDTAPSEKAASGVPPPSKTLGRS